MSDRMLNYIDIQTPPDVWSKILELNPIDVDDAFYEPFAGMNSLYDQITNKKYRTEITDGLDVFDFDFDNHQDVSVIYTNPPYFSSIPDKKGNFKERNAVYFFLEFFMIKFKNLKKIGFIMNMKCFNSLTPKRLKKLNDLGFTISSMTMFNCNYWYGIQIFIVFEKNNTGNCFKYIEKTFTQKITCPLKLA